MPNECPFWLNALMIVLIPPMLVWCVKIIFGVYIDLTVAKYFAILLMVFILQGA